MSKAYVSIGSNVEPERYIRIARQALETEFVAVWFSPVYRTAAVGFDGDDFLNLVAACETDKSVEDVDALMDALEQTNGRDCNAPRFAPRTLDLDLLLYDNLILEQDGLRLPRKDIMKYAFVLKPLADIAPDVRHPVDGRRFIELLRDLDLGSQRCDTVTFDW